MLRHRCRSALARGNPIRGRSCLRPPQEDGHPLAEEEEQRHPRVASFQDLETGVDYNIDQHCADVVVILDNRQAPHGSSIYGCKISYDNPISNIIHKIQL
jgi:hypothetical protein